MIAATGGSPRVHPGRKRARLSRSCATAARPSARSRASGAQLLHRPLRLLDLYESALERDPEAVAVATIPVEQISAPILLISGTDDRLWPSTTLAELAMTRLAESERAYHDMHLSYEGAGHLAGRPAGPPAGSQRYALGGTATDDLASHQDAWPHVLRQLAGNASKER